MQTTLLEPFGIDVYNSRTKATTAYQNQIIPFWRDFSQTMRSQYVNEGSLVNWNSISGAECPPIDSDAMSPGGARGWDTGLQETFVMTPIPGNTTFKIYIRCFYRLYGFLYTDEQPSYPRRVNAVINFKIGLDPAQLDKPDRTLHINNPAVGAASGRAYLNRRCYITAEKGFFSLTYGAMDRPETEYNSSLYISYVGDPLTNTPRTEALVVVNGTGNSSDTWYRIGGLYGNARMFTDTDGETYNATYIIPQNESAKMYCYNSYIVNPDQVTSEVTNPAGTETILIGPYFSSNAKVWTNVFPGTPFLVMPKSAGAMGAEVIINGWLYRATGSLADSGTNFYKQTRPWARIGDAPVEG